MTGVADLIAWLRSWLDVDERMALAAKDPDNAWWWDAPESPAEAHIARWHPDRVLAEVDAKRQVLELHADMDWAADPDGGFSSFAHCTGCGEVAPCTTARLLALPYADRPGYLPEWRP